jgi:membrane-bound serine protease (ClpP class)
MKHWLPILMVSLAGWPASNLGAADVGLIKINGAIGPATASYISRAIDVAAERDYSCLIIELDTPGGLLQSTKEIIQAFDASKLPVAVYVAPSGASATSAGCFITLAADIAAMTPHSSIGAAHPVELGASGAEKTDDVMKQKVENFAAGMIQGIAEKHHRNAEWAVSSVRDSAAITAEDALDKKVVDVIAKDLPELLDKIDGREVKDHILKTAGAKAVEIPMIPRERLFQLLWRPEVILVLMLATIYGIIGELSNPGAVLPGVIGGIALILSLYMATVLPVNLAGLALIGLSMVLFIIDLFAPTHGVLTFGGIISFFLGALMLFNRGDPAFHLSLAYIIPATAMTALFFIFVVGAGLRAQSLPVRAGRETMLGKTAPALARIDSSGGKVFIEGEYWNALSDVPIEPGQPVEVVGISGLTLKVKQKPSTA